MTHTDFDTDTIELSDVSVDDFINSKLVVYNDDHNTFQWVIECFCKYLKHGSEQAEQCAMLIHTRGKCEVKTGSKSELKPFKEALVDAGLSAVIE
jgi:ATP-dependent Clp protease adaptor protein ClpS